jgi:hypothetical protein
MHLLRLVRESSNARNFVFVALMSHGQSPTADKMVFGSYREAAILCRVCRAERQSALHAFTCPGQRGTHCASASHTGLRLKKLLNEIAVLADSRWGKQQIHKLHATLTWYVPSPDARPAPPDDLPPDLTRVVNAINDSDPLLGVLGVVPTDLRRLILTLLARKRPLGRDTPGLLDRLLDNLSLSILDNAWIAFHDYQHHAHPGRLLTPWDCLGGHRLADAMVRDLPVPARDPPAIAPRRRRVHWPKSGPVTAFY